MTALSTAPVGSMWKPPIPQQIPAGVRRRMSSGRMALRYDVNGAMTDALRRAPSRRRASKEIHEPCLEGGEDTFGRAAARAFQALQRHVCGEVACRKLACNETSRVSFPGHERARFGRASARIVSALVRQPRLDCTRASA